MVKNYAENNYTVVIDYVFFPDDIHQIVKGVKNINVKYVVLMADEDTIIKRDSCRVAHEQMGDRVVELLGEFKEKGIESTYILETSSLVVEKIVEEDRFLWRG